MIYGKTLRPRNFSIFNFKSKSETKKNKLTQIMYFIFLIISSFMLKNTKHTRFNLNFTSKFTTKKVNVDTLLFCFLTKNYKTKR